MCSKKNFSPENRAVYEIMWKNIIGRGRLQMTIWRLRIACWVTKATNTHSEYVILIAFPRQKCVAERASILRYSVIKKSLCTWRTIIVSCTDTFWSHYIAFPVKMWKKIYAYRYLTNVSEKGNKFLKLVPVGFSKSWHISTITKKTSYPQGSILIL